jgi:hypothetical protein
MAPGPERPDAAKGDQKIAGRHGLRIGRRPRRRAFRAGNAARVIHGGIAATHRGDVGAFSFSAAPLRMVNGPLSVAT